MARTIGESEAAEPRGCPTPGACSALNEIERLQFQLSEADHVIAAIELRREPWTGDLMEARDAAIGRHKGRIKDAR